MVTNPESDALEPEKDQNGRTAHWVKVGLIATASAFVGGLAAAWWYRKTLKTLRQSDETTLNPHFGIPQEEPTKDH